MTKDFLPWEDAPETTIEALGAKWRCCFTNSTHVFVEPLEAFTLFNRTYKNVSLHLFAEREDGLYRDEPRTPEGDWRGSGTFGSDLTDAARRKILEAVPAAVNLIPDLDTWKAKGTRRAARDTINRKLSDIAELREKIAEHRAQVVEATEAYLNACARLGVDVETWGEE